MLKKKTEEAVIEQCNPSEPHTMIAPNMSFTFVRRIDTPKGVDDLLFAGEKVVCCYATFRDYSVFTDKRLITRDIQGITGTKVSSLTIPYKAIKMYSVETAGIIGVDADITLWTTVGTVNLHLSRNIDVNEVCAIIAKAICD